MTGRKACAHLIEGDEWDIQEMLIVIASGRICHKSKKTQWDKFYVSDSGWSIMLVLV